MSALLRPLALAPLFALLSACGGDTQPADSQVAMELKIYQVAPDRLTVIGQALTRTVAGKHNKITELPPANLLVYAPHGQQASIAEAIDALGKNATATSSGNQLLVHLWSVDARPGEGADDPTLGALADTLKPLRQSLGPNHFTLDEAAAVTVAIGRKAQLMTPSHQYTVQGYNDGQAVSLNLTYSGAAYKGMSYLDTWISTQPGQYVVLAQAPAGRPASPATSIAAPAATDPVANATASPQPALHLLIIRVDRKTAST